MQTLVELAYGKVNLSLSVVGRYPDGYHELDMINCLVAVHDDLNCTKIDPVPGRDGGCLLTVVGDECGALSEVADSDNLIVRAAELFFAKTRINGACRVELTKRLPSGAGLGGGSSDAAAVVRALMRLYCDEVLGVNDDQLVSLHTGLCELGADIPYLLRGGLVNVTGRGQGYRRLCTDLIAEIDQHRIFLLLPEFSCSTPKVFSVARSLWQAEFPSARSLGDLPQDRLSLFGDFKNDLLIPARKIEPKLGEIYDSANAIEGLRVGLSGSGSTLFAIICNGSETAEHAIKALFQLADLKKFSVIETKLLAFEHDIWELFPRFKELGWLV